MPRQANIVPKTPITTISGFLGSGKTTLLRHLLENDDGLRVGVVVNDVASINLDARAIRAVADAEQDELDTVQTIELQNGCMCCTAAADLLLSVAELVRRAQARGAPHDHIVIEATGVADPSEVNERFLEARDDGHPLFEFVELHTLVTVVDAGALPTLLEANEAVGARPDLLEGDAAEDATLALTTGAADLPDSARARVSQLLIAQIECAHVLVLNKLDRLRSGGGEAEARAAAEAVELLRALNPRAAVLATSWGRVPPARVLAAAPVESEPMPRRAARTTADADAAGAARAGAGRSAVLWCDECAPAADAADAPAAAAREGAAGAGLAPAVVSFVYTRHRPFHARRLCERVLPHMRSAYALRRAPPGGAAEGEGGAASAAASVRGLLRSKGCAWLGSSHAQPYVWEHAGGHFHLTAHGLWDDADVQPRAQPQPPPQPPPIAHAASSGGEEGFADAAALGGGALAPLAGAGIGVRRQELVFIGTRELLPRALVQLLDSCLLSAEELAQYCEYWGADPASCSTAAC